MKTRLPIMIQDPTTTHIMGIKPVENFFALSESSYSDGPVADRIAVLDLDDETGKLLNGSRFVPPGRILPHFEYSKLPEGSSDLKTFKEYFKLSRDFNQASVFGTILRTINLFENKHVLGHRITWAFDSPQLLVVPRAGKWANAFYQRESHSLQFFYFTSAKDPEHIIFTSLSRDIVAHETTHAILDGICPDLYDSLTPQSLALHEAVADIAALLVATKSNNLVLAVLEKTNGAIKDSTVFSSIAPEFGMGRDPNGKAKYLRQLLNDKTLKSVSIDEPHDLSEVLSGALYSVLEKMHEEHRLRFSKESPFKEKENPMYACSGKSLAAASFRLMNTIFRALDYLPPGDTSFADYGQAIMAVDQAANLNKQEVRDWFKEEFIRRQIVSDEKALSVKTNFEYEPLQNVDLDRLVTNDRIAQQFADQNREFLHIPLGVPFKLLPRVIAEKTYYDVDRREVKVKECIFKVSWEHIEPNRFGHPLPEKRVIRRGTTLAINVEKRKVRFLLTSDRSQQQCDNRDRMLYRLVEDDLLRLDYQAIGPDGKTLRSIIPADTSSGYLRIRGAARLLHIAE